MKHELQPEPLEATHGDLFAQSFLEGHPYPILRLNHAGVVTYANPASMPILLEWSVEVGGTVGAGILEIINSVVVEQFARKTEVRHGQVIIELTFSVSCASGFIDVFGQDISLQKVAERAMIDSHEEAREAKKSLERAEIIGQYGSWEWNLTERSFRCSKGFIRIMQFPEDISPSFDFFMGRLLPEDRRILEPAMEEAVLSKQPFSCNYRIKLQDGSLRWLRSEGYPQLDDLDRAIKLVGTAQEVTEKVRAESELTEATLIANAATKSKAEFLANMSHEIRTPMNGVIGMCNLLLAEVNDPTHAAKLKIIQNCGNSLLNLINDILDFSKLEAGKIELENEPFDIHQTTEEIVQLFNSRASEKNLLLSYLPGSTVPLWGLGDTTRFRQILSNLISNSIKFTENGSITITSAVFKNEGPLFEIQFSVRDTGIGISESAKAKLFSAFTQADLSTTRKYGGTGLGLAICKGLCESMGGNIWLESQSGGGSTFHFTMKIAETHARAQSAPSDLLAQGSAQMGKKSPLSVLIAEDNRVNQLIAIGILEKLGYHPDVATNGVEVLDYLKSKTYDVIFMDFHMPVMDGLETTKRIAEGMKKEDRPHIVALTASAMKQDRDRCLAAGMDDFISKPIQSKEIVRVLASVFAQRQVGGKPAFDRELLFSNFKGIEDVLFESIESFLELRPSLVQGIQQAIEREDFKQLEIASHTLKGAVSNFYARSAGEVASDLEQIGKAGSQNEKGDPSEILPAKLGKLKEELDALCVALREVVSAKDLP